MGRAIIDNLKQEKVETKYIEIGKQRTGFSLVATYGKKNTDHIVFAFRGANEELEVNPKKLDEIKPDYIFVSSLSGKHWQGTLNKIFAWAKKHEVKVVWNPGSLQLAQGMTKLEVYLKRTDILILNKDEATEILIDILDKDDKESKIINPRKILSGLGSIVPGIVVMTDGIKGAWAKEFSRVYWQEVAKVKKQDTLGVGDAFGATFVWGLHEFSGDVRAALEVATINAGAVIEKPGAQAGLLTKNQLMKKL